MKNEFKPELWKPVVPEHHKPKKKYHSARRHHGFVEWQPISERYQVPGLLPKARKDNDGNNIPKPY